MPIYQSSKRRKKGRGKDNFIRVAISCGDAAGISYEIIFKSLPRLLKKQLPVRFLLIGDKSVAKANLKYLKSNLRPLFIKNENEIDFKQKINFIDLGLIKKFSLKNKAKPNALFGKASLKYIECAFKLIKEDKADCLVTAPINKKAINLYRKNFTGHTELLARLSKSKRIAMMLAGKVLRVVLVTRHIPLRKVSQLLNEKDILLTIELTDDYLKRFCALKKPKICLCALNPHAGEEGLFGREEDKIILPAAKKALGKGINLVGPIASDSAFERAYRGEFDAVVCLYHDQGLIPLKMVEREVSVNITLGLPFVRTSPAHGTAYDIAYQHQAKSDSFYHALRKSIEMVKNADRFK